MKYTPRRAGKRWREGAPDYILDCFDDKGWTDRYTVLFCGEFLMYTAKDGSICEGSDTFANTYVQYVGMSGAPTHPQGFSMWGELTAQQAAAYRYREGKHRVRWLDLPEHIRKHVIARATS